MGEVKKKRTFKIHPIFDFLKELLKGLKKTTSTICLLSVDNKILFVISLRLLNAPVSKIKVIARSRTERINTFEQEFFFNYKNHSLAKEGYVNLRSLFGPKNWSFIRSVTPVFYSRKETIDIPEVNEELNGLMEALKKTKECDLSGKHWKEVVSLS